MEHYFLQLLDYSLPKVNFQKRDLYLVVTTVIGGRLRTVSVMIWKAFNWEESVSDDSYKVDRPNIR